MWSISAMSRCQCFDLLIINNWRMCRNLPCLVDQKTLTDSLPSYGTIPINGTYLCYCLYIVFLLPGIKGHQMIILHLIFLYFSCNYTFFIFRDCFMCRLHLIRESQMKMWSLNFFPLNHEAHRHYESKYFQMLNNAHMTYMDYLCDFPCCVSLIYSLISVLIWSISSIAERLLVY